MACEFCLSFSFVNFLLRFSAALLKSTDERSRGTGCFFIGVRNVEGFRYDIMTSPTSQSRGGAHGIYSHPEVRHPMKCIRVCCGRINVDRIFCTGQGLTFHHRQTYEYEQVYFWR